MDIKVMRLIDKWVGIPICFILTPVAKIIRLFSKKKDTKKLLFIELAEMGSLVLAVPSIIKARKQYDVYFLVFEELKEPLELLGVVPKGNIMAIRTKSIFHFFIDTLKFVYICRKKKIDSVADLEYFSRYSAILTFLSFAKSSAGLHNFNSEGMYRGDLYTSKVQYSNYLHTSQMYLAILDSLKSSSVPANKFKVYEIPTLPFLRPKTKIWDHIRKINPDITKNSKIVVINPNSSMLIENRRWPLENYARLAKLLLENNDVFVVLTGTKAEYENGKFIENYLKSRRCINLAGKTSVKDLLGLFNISSLLITNDSGPAQFAALTRTKTIVLFGPETPLRFKPLNENCHAPYLGLSCSPCVSPFNQLESPCKDNICMKKIRVKSIYSLAKALLEGHKRF